MAAYELSATVPAPYALVFLLPDGAYGIYDYRNPGELRIDAEAEAMTTGHIKTGAITQDVAAGGEVFLRSVQQPGFYTGRTPRSQRHRAGGAVYTYVGSANIYQPIAPFAARKSQFPRRPAQSAGPRRLWEDSHQSSGVIQDRIHIPGRIQLIAGGRYDSLRDHNYSAYAHACTVSPILSRKRSVRPVPATPSDHRQARLAAAIRRHLQPRQEPHALLELRRDAVARAAGAVVG